MSSLNNYTILKIDAEKLINAVSLPDGKTPRYYLEYEDQGRSPLYKKTNRGDCALFYQIRKEFKKLNDDDPKKLNDDDPLCLLDKIVILDFGNYFNPISQYNMGDDIKRQIDEGVSLFSRADHLSRILDPSKGIDIRFGNEGTYSFSVFDKSSSMSRSCRISFIRSDLRRKIDKRLRIGIDFNKIEMVLSKYYAYRGLYLSTAKRIEQDKKFSLNENTVIVISDCVHHLVKDNGTAPESSEEKPLYYTYPEILQQDSFEDVKDGKRHFTPMKVYIKEDSTEPDYDQSVHGNDLVATINVFDGEGLISNDYSDYINRKIHKDEDPAHSFQVRFPFVKGMLHNVDFHQFIEDYFVGGDLYIEDCFGYSRKINDAQIILTESMFKCKKWLDTYWYDIKGHDRDSKDADNDPLKFFFSQAKKYDHTLYVSQDDTNYKEQEFDKINYQFFSTIDISSKDFEALIEKHFENGEEVIKKKLNPSNNDMLLRQDSFTIQSDGIRPLQKILIASTDNHSLLCKETIIKDYVKDQLKQLRIDCGIGRLYTEGRYKYLSADLLELLKYIGDKLVNKAGERASQSPHQEAEYGTTLYDARLTSSPYSAVEGENTYAILRNPHLSRNEELMASPNINQEKFSSDNNIQSELIRKKYFEKLTGIIMVPERNLSNICLGGADFDGDIVRMYYNKIITSGIKKGCYWDKPYLQGYVRQLPIMNIPSDGVDEKSKPSDNTKNIKLIIDTFSNQVGAISNMALKFAVNQYGPNPIEGYDYCSYCTAITGLEIDAAKKGKHPVEDINFLRDKCDSLENSLPARNLSGQYFIDFKEVFKYLRKRSYTVTSKGNSYLLNFDAPKSKRVIANALKFYSVEDNDSTDNSNASGKEKAILEISPQGKDCHNLLKLPYEFAKCEYNKESDSEKATEILDTLSSSGSNKQVILRFLKDSNWFDSICKNKDSFLDKEDKIHHLILAFNDIEKDIRNYTSAIEHIENDSASWDLQNLLKLKYDIDEKTGEFSENVALLLESSTAFIRSNLDSAEKLKTAINNLNKYSWHITKKETRPEVLKEILELSKGVNVDDEISAFLCNFSQKGYLILYYILKTLYFEKRLSLPFDKFNHEFIQEQVEKHKFGTLGTLNYYKDLLNAYVKVSRPTSKSPCNSIIDDEGDTFSNDDSNAYQNLDPSINSDDENVDNIEKYRALVTECRKLLFSIIADKAINNNEEINDELICNTIKYLWIERTARTKTPAKDHLPKKWIVPDNDGKFFWTILNTTEIKNNILVEEGGEIC